MVDQVNEASSVQTFLYLAAAEGLAIVSGSAEDWRGKRVLKGVRIQCVAVSAKAPELVYCGAFGQGIFVSGNRGLTWLNVPALASAKVTALFASGVAPCTPVRSQARSTVPATKGNLVSAWEPANPAIGSNLELSSEA